MTDTKKMTDEINTLRSEFISGLKEINESDISYLNDRNVYLWNNKYSYLDLIHHEHLDNGIMFMVIKDDNDDIRPICPFGSECSGLRPRMNMRLNKLQDGSCTFYHLLSHNDPECPHGAYCKLLDRNIPTDNPNKHHDGRPHYVLISIRGENHMWSTHEDHTLSKKIKIAMICTKDNRPGSEGCENKACSAIHMRKLDSTGNEMLASPLDKDAYIKIWGYEKDPTTQEQFWVNLSYANHPELRLFKIIDPNPYDNLPRNRCQRLWMDCKPEWRCFEENCHHFILGKILCKMWNNDLKREQELKLQLKIRFLTQTENKESNDPQFIDLDRLIDPRKTIERRIKKNNPDEAYVANDSYGGNFVQGDPTYGSLSVFFATGRHLYNEALIQKYLEKKKGSSTATKYNQLTNKNGETIASIINDLH